MASEDDLEKVRDGLRRVFIGSTDKEIDDALRFAGVDVGTLALRRQRAAMAQALSRQAYDVEPSEDGEIEPLPDLPNDVYDALYGRVDMTGIEEATTMLWDAMTLEQQHQWLGANIPDDMRFELAAAWRPKGEQDVGEDV